MKMRRPFVAPLCLLFVLICAVVRTPNLHAGGSEDFTRAKFVNAIVDYPNSLAERGEEAWIELRFDVNQDGTVSEVRVVRSSNGNKKFEDAALKSFRKATFEPATKNGVRVDCANVPYAFAFMLKPGQRAGSRSFVKSYRKIHRMIDDRQLVEAAAEIDKLEKKGGLSLSQTEYLSFTRARFFDAKGDRAQALASLTYTLNILVWRNLPRPIRQSFAELLRSKYILAAKFSDARVLLETYEQMQDIELEIDDAIRSHANEVKSMVNGDQPFGSSGYILGGEWHYVPFHKRFAIKDVNGSINSVNVACNLDEFDFVFNSQLEWNIPNDVGDCEIGVKGEDGTTFTLVEYPG